MIIWTSSENKKIEVHEPSRLNDSDIKRVTNTKSLGIIVDEGLNWERQYRTVHNKSRGGLQSLRRLKGILPQSSLSNVYRALIETHIRYSDVVWGSLSNSKIEFLQRLQNRAVSMIQTSRKKDDWTPEFLAVEQLIAFDRAVMVCEIFNKLCSENLWNKYHLRFHYFRCNTRFCRNIQIPKYNLEYAEKVSSYSALKAWNETPLSIRELLTLSHLKKQLKMYLMS